MKAEHEIERIEDAATEVAATGNEIAVTDSESAAAGSEAAATDNAVEVNDTGVLTNDDEPLEAPRFVIKTRLNARMQYEASRALTPKYARITVWVCVGLAAVMFCLALVQFFRTQDSGNLLMAGILALLLVYLCYAQFSSPKKALRRWEDNLRRSFGTNELHLTTEFFALNVAQSLEERDDVTVEGYSAIGRTVETEHLLLLQSGGKNWFFLEKDGLQNGTVDELKAFLAEHIGGK